MTYNHGKYYFTQLYVREKNSITWGLKKNIHSHSNHPQKSNGWSLMVKVISLFQLTNEINQQKVPHSCVPSCQGCKTFCSLSVAVYSSQAMGCSRSVSPIRHFLTQSLVFRLLNCLSIETTVRHLRPQWTLLSTVSTKVIAVGEVYIRDNNEHCLPCFWFVAVLIQLKSGPWTFSSIIID